MLNDPVVQQWTDYRIQLLRTMWAQKFTAKRIAAELGGVTRNAVLGKIHRLGLSGVPKADAAKATRKEVLRPDPEFVVSAENMEKLADLRSQGKSVFEIARAFSCSVLSVRIAVRSLGVPVKTPIARVDHVSQTNTDAPLSAPFEFDEGAARSIFSERKATECAWIFGDPAAHAPVCGEQVLGMGSYCSFHHRLAYTKYERRAG